MGVYSEMFDRLRDITQERYIGYYSTETDSEKISFYIDTHDSKKVLQKQFVNVPLGFIEKFVKKGYTFYLDTLNTDNNSLKNIPSGVASAYINCSDLYYSVFSVDDSEHIKILQNITREEKCVTEKECYRLCKQGHLSRIEYLKPLQLCKDYFRAIESLVIRMYGNKEFKFIWKLLDNHYIMFVIHDDFEMRFLQNGLSVIGMNRDDFNFGIFNDKGCSYKTSFGYYNFLQFFKKKCDTIEKIKLLHS